MQVTVNDIMELRPCSEYTRDCVKTLWNGRKSLTLLEISELDIPFNDRLWAISKLLKDSHARELRLFSCDCAERVLPIFEDRYPDDNRPRTAIDVARRYANGEATEVELNESYYAARIAWAAARDTRGEWVARAAAWVACDDVRAAATATAAAAARGARQKEQEWQLERLQQMIKEIEK